MAAAPQVLCISNKGPCEQPKKARQPALIYFADKKAQKEKEESEGKENAPAAATTEGEDAGSAMPSAAADTEAQEKGPVMACPKGFAQHRAQQEEAPMPMQQQQPAASPQPATVEPRKKGMKLVNKALSKVGEEPEKQEPPKTEGCCMVAPGAVEIEEAITGDAQEVLTADAQKSASSSQPKFVPKPRCHRTTRVALELRVSGIGGPLCNVSLQLPAMLSDLKEAIAAKTGIPPFAQRIVHGTQELTAQTCLLEFADGEVIDLVLLQCPWGAGSLLQRVLEGSMTEIQVDQALRDNEDVKGNRDVVLAVVARCGCALKHATAELKADREVVLAAVLKDGTALQFASAELQQDRRVAFAAAIMDRAALEWVAADVLSDCEKFMGAVDQHGHADVLHKEEGLHLDRDAVLAVVAKDGSAVQHASDELKGDPEVALAAVAQCVAVLQCLPAKHRKDRSVMLAAVRQNPTALLMASKEVKADREVVLTAAQQKAETLQFADASLRSDKLFLDLLRGRRGRSKVAGWEPNKRDLAAAYGLEADSSSESSGSPSSWSGTDAQVADPGTSSQDRRTYNSYGVLQVADPETSSQDRRRRRDDRFRRIMKDLRNHQLQQQRQQQQ